MSKRTAVIDIGSNSARVSIYEKSSRFAFHLLEEKKIRVRLIEDSLKNDFNLQPSAMNRAILALKNFKDIALNLKCSKIICIATAALRDAKNKKEFIQKVKTKTKLHIKIISGEKEAYLGSISVINLLMPNIKDAIVVDIGGGSTEYSKIVNSKVVYTKSIKVGVLTIKEACNNKKETIDYVNEELSRIPDCFKSKTLIGIGGSVRCISKAIMKRISYPLKTIHGFEYKVDEHIDFIKKISTLDKDKIERLNLFSKSRVDIISYGALILLLILKRINIEKIIVSGTGLREGIYLADILRNSKNMFLKNFDISKKNILDRMPRKDKSKIECRRKIANKLFDVLKSIHKIDSLYKKELLVATQVLGIGKSMNFYLSTELDFQIISSSLNYNYTHKEKMLVAFILYYCNSPLDKREFKKYKKLLPSIETIRWLSFILFISDKLSTNFVKKVLFEYEDKTLYVATDKPSYIIDDEFTKIRIKNDIKLVAKSI